MAKSQIKKSDYKSKKLAGLTSFGLENGKLELFTSSILGLGNISTPSKSTDAVAAIFDLEGFTNFCKQIEPHLSVPKFLNEFTNWIFDAIKKDMIKETEENFVSLWSPLPFYIKFMGDGLLVLWDVSNITDGIRKNIVISCQNICNEYKNIFLPKIRKLVAEPPKVLRCGIARGTVYSVGNGQDYIGSCINMASRLQKLYDTSFAFNCRGFEINETDLSSGPLKAYTQKEVIIRGIGEHELVCIPLQWFKNISAENKRNFKDL